jgi:Histidine kinase-, DNA gyrase B-, and HSP90-like ATPase
MKEQIGTVDALPTKRVYKSIIADYDPNIALCELVDNAIDQWNTTERKQKLRVRIDLNLEQQVVQVLDNAGGLAQKDLKCLVSPGLSKITGKTESIGIFGVGGKRSVVAIAQKIAISSRYRKEPTLLVEYDDAWLEKDAEWELPFFRVSNIEPGSTVIELSKLRFTLEPEFVTTLKDHLSATYGTFLSRDLIEIYLQKEPVPGRLFENWAFPPQYPPTEGRSELQTAEGDKIKFRGIAGLMTEPASVAGEYGVYFYCNDRLIARGLKAPEVGFTQPHHSVSLVRVLVFLNGPSECMPWNSSKSSINYSHAIFRTIRKWLLSNVEYYCALSRRLQPEWDESVFAHKHGEPVKYQIESFDRVPASFRAALPTMRPNYRDAMEDANQRLSDEKPWAKGLYEGVVAVDLIFKQKRLEQKNRICLIVLDSTLEIAFKDYLLNHEAKPVGVNEIRNKSREQIQKLVENHNVVPKNLWERITYYYRIRCQLIHERSAARITDEEIVNFRNIVQVALKKMFGIRWVDVTQ